jgi:hypothetical protein
MVLIADGPEQVIFLFRYEFLIETVRPESEEQAWTK